MRVRSDEYETRCYRAGAIALPGRQALAQARNPNSLAPSARPRTARIVYKAQLIGASPCTRGLCTGSLRAALGCVSPHHDARQRSARSAGQR